MPAGALPTTDKKIGSAAAATEPITPQEDAKTVPFLGTPPPNYALTNLLLNAKKSISVSYQLFSYEMSTLNYH